MMGLLGGDPGPGPESRFVYPEVMVSVVLAGLLGLVAVAVLVVVVFPAVWSRKKRRRHAALKVLDRILRLR
jgi:type II secretory pathway component PulJ